MKQLEGHDCSVLRLLWISESQIASSASDGLVKVDFTLQIFGLRGKFSLICSWGFFPGGALLFFSLGELCCFFSLGELCCIFPWGSSAVFFPGGALLFFFLGELCCYFFPGEARSAVVLSLFISLLP